MSIVPDGEELTCADQYGATFRRSDTKFDWRTEATVVASGCTPALAAAKTVAAPVLTWAVCVMRTHPADGIETLVAAGCNHATPVAAGVVPTKSAAAVLGSMTRIRSAICAAVYGDAVGHGVGHAGTAHAGAVSQHSAEDEEPRQLDDEDVLVVGHPRQ